MNTLELQPYPSRGLLNQVLRHAVTQGWVGYLFVLWLAGLAAFLLLWELPLYGAIWTVFAVSTCAAMLMNELRSEDVARESLAVSLMRRLEIASLGSVQDASQLEANIASFAAIVIAIHTEGPKRLHNAYLEHAVDNMYALLGTHAMAAHAAEATWELELSPETCALYEVAWAELRERGAEGADPGPRFAMEFARATNEVLSRVRGGVTPAQQPASTQPGPDTDRKAMVRETHLALRNLANPAKLAESPLILRLPRSLETVRREAGPAEPGVISRLDQARLLRLVIIAAIERLGAAQGVRPELGTLGHIALQERYVLHRPIKAIISHHGYGETTFHDHRQKAISVLAADLAEREELLSRQAASSTTTA